LPYDIAEMEIRPANMNNIITIRYISSFMIIPRAGRLSARRKQTMED
jgi:hypothetical protein